MGDCLPSQRFPQVETGPSFWQKKNFKVPLPPIAILSQITVFERRQFFCLPTFLADFKFQLPTIIISSSYNFSPKIDFKKKFRFKIFSFPNFSLKTFYCKMSRFQTIKEIYLKNNYFCCKIYSS